MQARSQLGRIRYVSLLWLIESAGHSVASDSLRLHGLYSPWNSPGQDTGVGSLSLLQGILPTQGWNPGLPHCRQMLYKLSQQGSPSLLEWVAHPFSRGSCWPRNLTRVSCTAGRFFTNWAISLWLISCVYSGKLFYLSSRMTVFVPRVVVKMKWDHAWTKIPLMVCYLD